MQLTVFGLWHLGSVTAACMADLGHDVIGVDPSSENIDNLNQGRAPIFEPGLDELITKGINSSNLHFKNNIPSSFQDVELLWITFDTPVNEDDVADTSYVLQQAKGVLGFLADESTVIISSQLPVGSIASLESYVKANFPHKNIYFVSAPENLRLGKSIEIFLNPDRIIVGIRGNERKLKVSQLFGSITEKIEWMSVESAEVTKHAINAFLATSVCFANEIAAVCEKVGASAKEVERGLKTEVRIGPKAYLSPGGPFAGGTLARDLEFLKKMGEVHNIPLPLLWSVQKSNDAHKAWIKRRLEGFFPTLDGIKICMWGLTYKVGTDTLRRSLSVELCNWLLNKGALINVFDPLVKELPADWGRNITNAEEALDALRSSDVLVIGTECPEFRDQVDRIPDVFLNRQLLVLDPSHFLEKDFLANQFEGLRYVTVGSNFYGKSLNE